MEPLKSLCLRGLFFVCRAPDYMKVQQCNRGGSGLIIYDGGIQLLRNFLRRDRQRLYWRIPWYIPN